MANIKPTWARMYTADHRAVMDISVGVRDANLIVLAEYLERGMTLSLRFLYAYNREEINMKSRMCFAQAKFCIERQLAELGKALNPRLLEIGLCEDNRGVIIYHPDGAEHWVTSCFELPVAIDPDEFDAAAYVAQFECKLIAH